MISTRLTVLCGVAGLEDSMELQDGEEDDDEEEEEVEDFSCPS